MRRLNFSREHRVTRRSEYTACYSQGRRYSSKRFILFVLPRSDKDAALRSGTGVGKKFGNAPCRNRVKRLVREFFRLYRYDIGHGLDCAVVPKRGVNCKHLNLHILVDELLPLLKKARKQFSM